MTYSLHCPCLCFVSFFGTFSVILVTLKCIETGLPSQTAYLCRGGIMRYCREVFLLFWGLFTTVQYIHVDLLIPCQTCWEGTTSEN